MEKHRHIPSLALVRVIAAIGVMIAHFLAHLHGVLGISLARVERLNFVDLFFVLSGFLLAGVYGAKVTTPTGRWRFLRQRFARLYPLHALTCLTFAGAGIVFNAWGVSFREPATFDPGQAPQHLLLLHAWNTVARGGLNGPSWSLSAEFFLLLLFPVLVRIHDRAGAEGGIAMALATALGFHLFREATGQGPWSEATFQFGIFRALPFFVMGMAVERFLRERPGRTTPWVVTLAFACVVLLLICLDAPHETSLVTFPVLVAMIAMSDRRKSPEFLAPPIVDKMANLTYGVFLLHTLSGLLLVATVRALGITSTGAIVLSMGVAAALTFAAASITFRLFESPMRSLLSPGDGHARAREVFARTGGFALVGYSFVLPLAFIAGLFELISR